MRIFSKGNTDPWSLRRTLPRSHEDSHAQDRALMNIQMADRLQSNGRPNVPNSFQQLRTPKERTPFPWRHKSYFLADFMYQYDSFKPVSSEPESRYLSPWPLWPAAIISVSKPSGYPGQRQGERKHPCKIPVFLVVSWESFWKTHLWRHHGSWEKAQAENGQSRREEKTG